MTIDPVQYEQDPGCDDVAPCHRTNLAGRIGRWSARHRKTAIFGWLAFVFASFFVGSFVIGAQQATDASGPGESGRALEILDDGFRQPAAETVLIQSDGLQANSPEFVAATRAVVAALGREPEVMNIRSPLDPENAGQISGDGHSAIVDFQIRGDADLAVEKIDPILLALADAQTAHQEVFIGTFGDASVDQELEGAFMDDLKKAGVYSVPITLIILIVVFGALVAAGIPLLLALTAVIATFGLWAIPSQSGRATSRCTRWCFSSALPSESTTRCSIEARARGARRRAGARKRRSTSPLRRPGARCSSQGRPSSSRWRACSSPATPSRRSEWRP